MTQVLKGLSSKHKALSSTPWYGKKKGFISLVKMKSQSPSLK
jgi:hypothetical protein